MKTLPTQFDSGRLSPAVATPSCCSSCCCCCCLATALTSSTLLAKYASNQVKQKQLTNRTWVAVVAALFIPILIMVNILFWPLLLPLSYIFNFLNWLIPDLFIEFFSYLGPALLLALVLLWFIFKKLESRRPWLSAIAIVVAILCFTALEIFAFFLSLVVFGGAGIFVHVILAIFLTIAITAGYSGRLKSSQPSWAAENMAGGVTPSVTYQADADSSMNTDSYKQVEPGDNSNNQGSSNVVYPPSQSESDSTDKSSQ